MSDLYARVRVVIDVPFKADVDTDTVDRTIAELLEARGASDGTAEHAAKIQALSEQVAAMQDVASSQRVAAAVHAETKLVDKVTAALAKQGTVVETVVEEVHE